MSTVPLDGLLVLDFSQFLAGPSAALRLADMGATVIKVERPDGGDLCRSLYITDTDIDGDSTIFHTINRNKRSYAADLKNPDDLAKVKKLIARADVMIENFRPGVMERIGLDYASVKAINPRLVYGSVTGYGRTGPWVDWPGQDLLVQSLSGLAHLSGDADQGPVPVGIAVIDILTGAHLVQGLLAALVRRGINNQGAHVEVSLLESAIDFQFEVLTTWLNDGNRTPQRAKVNNAHAWLGAPYGIYQTADDHIAIAMGALSKLSGALGCPALLEYSAQDTFTKRDEIKAVLAAHLLTRPRSYWLERLREVDYWAAPVLSWDELVTHEAFTSLDILQTVQSFAGNAVHTTRCPIRFNNERPVSARGAPKIGDSNAWVEQNYL